MHRDIKPDNVLLSGGSAVVTDFGIAKAISARAHRRAGRRRSRRSGTSIGTPAYMAPEQAAADPATDHRADIYSFGCLAYELLAGRPPFAGQVAAEAARGAHGRDAAAGRASCAPTCRRRSPQLVMQCLAKDADDRPQRAADIVRVLETVTSSAAHDGDADDPRERTRHVRSARCSCTCWRSSIVAVVAKAAIVAIGLPDWVFPGALVVMALGLPVILFTAYVHRTTRRVIGGDADVHAGRHAEPRRRARWRSWRSRRARTCRGGARALGGVAAVGGFVLLVGVYMVLRAMGIGPAGSLLAAGALGENEKILVADLPSPGQRLDARPRRDATRSARRSASRRA